MSAALFIRQPNAFIQPFGDKEGGLKAEANRFGIYWATGCNWSNRPIIVRELLGLQDVISETRVFSIRRDKTVTDMHSDSIRISRIRRQALTS